jgi:hypothetical protein
MSDTKEIILTGDAAEGIRSHGGRRRSRSRSRKNQKGSGSTQAGTITQLHSTSSSSDDATATATATAGINPSRIAEVAANITAPTTILKGGLQTPKSTKVILSAPKKKTQKVILSVAKTIQIPKPTTVSQKAKTRKASKRIQFSLKNLRTKLHKAKTIKKSSEEKSLDEIKKILTESKLIKTDSKAPEQMIRQIYNDFMTMKHKAL